MRLLMVFLIYSATFSLLAKGEDVIPYEYLVGNSSVSMISLATNPEKFYGEDILVSGFLLAEGKSVMLYFTRDLSYQDGSDKLLLASPESKEKVNLMGEKFNECHVLVYGEFVEYGRGDGFWGALKVKHMMFSTTRYLEDYKEYNSECVFVNQNKESKGPAPN